METKQLKAIIKMVYEKSDVTDKKEDMKEGELEIVDKEDIYHIKKRREYSEKYRVVVSVSEVKEVQRDFVNRKAVINKKYIGQLEQI